LVSGVVAEEEALCSINEFILSTCKAWMKGSSVHCKGNIVWTEDNGMSLSYCSCLAVGAKVLEQIALLRQVLQRVRW
jgi:hypothetical protein